MLSQKNFKFYSKREFAIINIMQIKKFKISASIQNLTKMFFETLSNSLNTHDQVKYTIDFIDNQISRIKSYYNMSQDKLSIIREYLFTTLKKKWIRSFNSFIKASMLFVKKLDDNLRLCVNYRKLNEMTMKNKYSLSLLLKIFDRFTVLDILSKSTFATLIIAFEFAKVTSERQRFELDMNSLSIK